MLDALRWQITDEAMKYSLENEGQISEDKSLYDFVANRAAQVLPEEGDQELLLGMAQLWGDYVGDPICRQSLKFSWMEECCGGGSSWPSWYFDTMSLISKQKS